MAIAWWVYGANSRPLMVTVFLPIRLKRNRRSWDCQPAEGMERKLIKKKRKRGWGKEGRSGREMGEEEEGSRSLATFSLRAN